MKNLMKLFAFVAVVACASFVFADSGSDTITVTANNEGAFIFTITDASFAFGVVNANGTGDTSGSVVVNGASGATYTKAAASSFDISSAPVRTVYIFNSSSPYAEVWGSGASLEMQIPSASLGEGTSCGYLGFDTAGDGGAAACASGNLYHGLSVGNDADAENGDLDLRLTVANVDGTGSNSWIVSLTATGI